MPKTVMPMTFDEFRRSCQAGNDHRPITLAARQQQRLFRDPSTAARPVVQRALAMIAGWVMWDPDGAAGA